MERPDLDAMQSWYLTEALTAAVIENAVVPGMVVLDVGANRGFHTSTLSRLVGPDGRVHAVEPNPAHFAVLARIPHTRLWPFAAGDALRLAKLHVPRAEDGWASLAVQPWWGEATEYDLVDTVELCLDALDELASAPVAFVKLDVEGRESAALRGMRSLLRRCQPPVVVENPDEDAHGLFGEEGYTLFHLDGSPGSSDGPGLGLANLVALPAKDVERRAAILPDRAKYGLAVERALSRSFVFGA